MNVYDSERIAILLQPHGYVLTQDKNEADIIILNTCHIREKATQKLYSDVGRLRKKFEQSDTKPIIAVAGCTAQAEGSEIMKRAQDVQIVIGPQNYHMLPELLAQYEREEYKEKSKEYSKERAKKYVSVDFPLESKFDHLPLGDSPSISSFVTIQEGCDKFCTFCVVPYTRGAEFSRPVSDIVKECKHLVEKGAKEITLLGQNVNAYHGKSSQGNVWNLANLCNALSEISGLQRIRYTTSHPLDMDDELIAAHGKNEKLMPFLHLPVQSGSDKILKSMNRKHTAKEYYDVIEKLKMHCPNIALSSDFIVGFPGESDQDFMQTLKLVNDITFASSYSFKYSMRPGTPASLLEQVDEKVKEERLQALQQILVAQQQAFNFTKIGQKMDILIEKQGRYPNQLVGRSPWLQPVHVTIEGDLSSHYGKTYTCLVEKIEGFSLFGSLCH